MTNQEKKAFLLKYSKCNKKISLLIEELYLWETRATKITSVNTGMPKGSGTSDKISSSVARIIQIKEELQSEIDKLSDMTSKVYKAINSLNDPTLETLLMYRYIKGLSWEEIAVKMNYSLMQVCRMHGKALSKMMLQNVIECYTKNEI